MNFAQHLMLTLLTAINFATFWLYSFFSIRWKWIDLNELTRIIIKAIVIIRIITVIDHSKNQSLKIIETRKGIQRAALKWLAINFLTVPITSSSSALALDIHKFNACASHDIRNSESACFYYCIRVNCFNAKLWSAYNVMKELIIDKIFKNKRKTKESK